MAANGTLPRLGQYVASGRFADAARLLQEAVAAGDAEAMLELAHWRIRGNIVRRDLAAARDLLGRSAAGGNETARRLHAYFLASGVGGPADWAGALAGLRALAARDSQAKAQLRLLDRMKLQADGTPVSLAEGDALAAAPAVTLYRDFLTAAECDYLRDLGTPALQPSVVVDPHTGAMVPNPIRVSDAAAFGVYDEDLVVNAINRRIAAHSATAPGQGEPLQLLRYRAGGEYRAHMDALPNEPNQRQSTMLVYLSDGYTGGETVFPRIGLRVSSKKGDALLFRNVDGAGRPEPLSIHAGLPVTRGEKLIATRWIRQTRFTYPPPHPMLDAL